MWHTIQCTYVRYTCIASAATPTCPLVGLCLMMAYMYIIIGIYIYRLHGRIDGSLIDIHVYVVYTSLKLIGVAGALRSLHTYIYWNYHVALNYICCSSRYHMHFQM